MTTFNRGGFEKHIFTSAPLLFRCKTHGYMDPDDVLSAEDVAFHAEIGVTPQSPVRKYPPIHFYGIECGSGWFPIIEATSSELEVRLARILQTGVNDDELPAVFQIKQKFGFLRIAMRGFSADGIPSEIRSLIHKAETHSRLVCESCGSGGLNPHRQGMESRCPNCR